MVDQTRYSALDELLLQLLSGEPVLARVLAYSPGVANECSRVSKEAGKGRPAFRYLDDRLRALRKAGKIKATGRGWVVVPTLPPKATDEA